MALWAMPTPVTGIGRSACWRTKAWRKCAVPDIPIGAFAENILTQGIEVCKLPIGTKLQIGEVTLQVTQIGKECHADCAIRKQVGDCVMPREGIFAIVLAGGIIRPGDGIRIQNERD